jgi:hypothetical protein
MLGLVSFEPKLSIVPECIDLYNVLHGYETPASPLAGAHALANPRFAQPIT